MNTFYVSDNLEATWDDKGFLEIVVHEGKSFPFEDRLALFNKLAELQVSNTKVLISRYHYYPPPPDYLLFDIGSFKKIHIAKVAYFAPSPTSQTLSHLVGITALTKVPYKVFSDRKDAIAWLLSEDTA